MRNLLLENGYLSFFSISWYDMKFTFALGQHWEMRLNDDVINLQFAYVTLPESYFWSLNYKAVVWAGWLCYLLSWIIQGYHLFSSFNFILHKEVQGVRLTLKKHGIYTEEKKEMITGKFSLFIYIITSRKVKELIKVVMTRLIVIDIAPETELSCTCCFVNARL